MKISIVGPVAPFSSGVARHTTALARELAGRDDVQLSVWSFSRQYPKSLYPGESDTDPHAFADEAIGAQFCIDSLNPLTWMATANRILKTVPDLVIVPAWTFFLAPCLGAIAWRLRRAGVQVVMVVHNAQDHEAKWWKRQFSRFQLRQASRFVTHNPSIAEALADIAPGIPAAVCSHPAYDTYPDPKGTLPRRAALELLFFGVVRPYKGLPVALRGLALSGLTDVRLTIAGEFWNGTSEAESLVRELGLADRVELIARYVSDEEAAELFHRCDVLLAPYISVTGSGVVALAQHYGVPVIASDIPGLNEAVIDGKTGWLFPASDADALGALLETGVSRQSAEAMKPDILDMKRQNSWQKLAGTLLGDQVK